jgi:glycopeptide antibiotics resistance protein
LLALAGILFLTFYPFRFALRSSHLAHSSPFLLGGVAKGGSRELLDDTLNILLFMPFGFGVSEKLRERGWTGRTIFIATWIVGFLLSYSIEFTQQYTPSRQSRWEDVCTNTTGAIAGFLLFVLCRKWLVKWASKVEDALRAWLTIRRVAVLLPIYFILWFGLSAILQKDARYINIASDPRSLASARSAAAFELGPGTALAKQIHHVKMSEVQGYNFIYDALIFIPAGALFGMAAVPFGARDTTASLFLAAEFLLSPWLLERILWDVGGHPPSVESILLSLLLVVAGGFWINADRRSAVTDT